MSVEIINDELCKECGGKCCQLYYKPRFMFIGTAHDCHNWWHSKTKENYDVKPLYDPDEILPLLSNKDYDNPKFQELISKGIDPSFCEYCHPITGCIIERDKRPPGCNAHKCDGFEEGRYMEKFWGKLFIPVTTSGVRLW